MSDDLDKKIKQISDLLGGQDNLADNIKGLLTLLSNSSTNSNPASSSTTNNTNAASSTQKQSNIPLSNDSPETKKENDDVADMARKITKIMNGVNPSTDPRIGLLLSLKPFLNPKRQNKLSTCIKMLNMSKMARLLDENDKSIL